MSTTIEKVAVQLTYDDVRKINLTVEPYYTYLDHDYGTVRVLDYFYATVHYEIKNLARVNEFINNKSLQEFFSLKQFNERQTIYDISIDPSDVSVEERGCFLEINRIDNHLYITRRLFPIEQSSYYDNFLKKKQLSSDTADSEYINHIKWILGLILKFFFPCNMHLDSIPLSNHELEILLCWTRAHSYLNEVATQALNEYKQQKQKIVVMKSYLIQFPNGIHKMIENYLLEEPPKNESEVRAACKGS